ncbi:Transcriptional regulator (modular protein) [Streptantibioticus cattleyicolor NRRL 8057 = DSM 46488]|nr:Transcriptional regulator (modular protein) [Streptantibioticus cattleyicolor NRRL 8057 = DSM 46488]
MGVGAAGGPGAPGSGAAGGSAGPDGPGASAGRGAGVGASGAAGHGAAVGRSAPGDPAAPSGPVGDAATADPAVVARLRLAVARLHRRLVQASSGQGLTYGQLSALARIEQHGPVRLGELAGLERVSAPSMTRTLAPLGAAGLIRRTPDPVDRRSALIELTGEGAHVLDEVRRERSELLAARIEALTPAQRAALEAAVPVLETLAEEPGPGR